MSDKLQRELTREKEKPPKIEYREREVVKLEPKCVKCNKKEFAYKLGQLKFITYGALAYSIIITIISIIKNDLIKSDLKNFIERVCIFVQCILNDVNNGFLGLSNKVDNYILHWVIHIGLWVLIVSVIGFGIYKLVESLKYKKWSFWNIYASSILLLDLAVVVFLGKYIKKLINMNLIWFAISVYVAYIIIRIVAYYQYRNS